MNYYTKNTLLGKITIIEERGFITELNLGSIVKGKNALTPVLEEAFLQLEQYFNKERTVFNLPLNPKGTSFQQKVWSALYLIPYGKTKSYKQIAEAIGDNNASRAVGMANNKNPIPIIIPCHRVIGADGSLTGYAYGLKIKKKLLDLEML